MKWRMTFISGNTSYILLVLLLLLITTSSEYEGRYIDNTTAGVGTTNSKEYSSLGQQLSLLESLMNPDA